MAFIQSRRKPEASRFYDMRVSDASSPFQPSSQPRLVTCGDSIDIPSMTSTAQEPYRLGYVGLGNLGTEICKNLGRHASSQNLTPLSLYNRTSAKYSAVSDECPGAHFAEEVAEVVQRSNVVFTCLLDDAAAEEVYGKIFKAVKREDKVVFVDQSTLTPTRASEYRSGLMTGHADALLVIRKIGKSSSRSWSDIPLMPRLR